MVRGFLGAATFFVFSFLTFANPVLLNNGFDKRKINGAFCGLGQDYHVWVRPGSDDTLVYFLQGGGMCWNFTTCFEVPMGALNPKPSSDLRQGILNFAEYNPLKNATWVYVPYCTADIYTGRHNANYKGKIVKHAGRQNMEAVIETLKNTPYDMSDFGRVLIYGESAGALGTLLNTDLWEQEISPQASAHILSDSPGLHFSRSVWSRFTNNTLDDLRSALQRVGISFNPNSGMLAREIPNLCGKFSRFRIGFMQGSMDLVMSSVFGAVNPFDHRKLLYSKDGLDEVLSNPNDNCASWVPDTFRHVFFANDRSSATATADGADAWSFLNNVMDQNDEFRSHR